MGHETRTKRVKSEIKKFCMVMSAHGVPRVARSERVCVRCIWLFVVLGCFASFCFHANQIIAKFNKKDKIINIAMNIGPVPFPAVTICNMNPYKQTAALDVPELRLTMNVFEQAAKDMKANDSVSREKRSSPTTRYIPVVSGCDCPKPGADCIRIKGPPPNGTGLCVCFYDQISRMAWPCYDKATWTMRKCAGCSPGTGTCPYPTPKVESSASSRPCFCQNISNYCIAVNLTKTVAAMEDVLVDLWDLTTTPAPSPTSTEAAGLLEAMGFREISGRGSLMSKGMEVFAYAAATLDESIRVNISYQSDDIIKICSFNGKECNMKKDFTMLVDSTCGNCFTYNRRSAKNTSRSGRAYGLKVTAYLNPADYLQVTEAAGIRLTVHDPDEYPFPDTFGYNSPPGQLTSFGLQMKRIKRLAPPAGECVTDEEGKGVDYIYPNYSYSTENFIISECDCGDPRFPTPHRIPHCPISDNVKRVCVEDALAQSKVKEFKCRQACMQTVYDVSISAAKWPVSVYQLPKDCPVDEVDCLEEYRQNGAMLEVYYERTGHEQLVESQAFGWSSLMADFGGQLGLWMGASVITLTELIVLLWNIILISCEDRSVGRDGEPVPTEEPNDSGYRKSKPNRRKRSVNLRDDLNQEKPCDWRIMGRPRERHTYG